MGESRRRRSRRRDDVVETELVGGIEQRDLFLVDNDPAWLHRYADHGARIREALGETAVSVEHVGSTAVAGLEEVKARARTAFRPTP